MEPLVELFDSNDATSWLSRLKDQSGRYYLPLSRATFDADFREGLRAAYATMSNADMGRFDAVWPHLWKLQDLHRPDGSVSDVVAVLDSGVMLDHPLMKRFLWKALDVTGEGVEDSVGHGTAIALLSGTTTFVPLNLVSIKVISANGKGQPKHLIEGLRLLRAIKEREGLKSVLANLSLGVYSRRWGFLECDGTCDVCRAAIEAAEHGITVLAAAGNQAGKTACPAIAGIKNPDVGVIPIGASDLPNSGIGETTISGIFSFVPLETDL